MTYKIFAINPGSTSTKVALFNGEECLFSKNIAHSADELKQFKDLLSGSSITAHAQETEADEEDSIYNYFTPEEVQRMEQNLVEIGLQKAGYYSSAMHTGNISTTQSITGV